MRCASIDMGTNTLRLLVADMIGGNLREVLVRREITRLGGGYTEEGGITASARARALKALEGFREAIDGAGTVERVFATGTSVLRRAANTPDFLEEIRDRTGIEVEVISGEEEARLSLLGVLSVVDASGAMLVVDIGGGSTEFIATGGEGSKRPWSVSTDLGVVHLTEKFLRSDPPAADELAGLGTEIREGIRGLKERMRRGGLEPSRWSRSGGAALVGTAGTVTTLAALDLDLETYDKDRINNHRLTRARVEELFKKLSSMTLSEREEILSLEKGREDLIIPGSVIVSETMALFGFAEMVVSDAGLLEGIILDRAAG